MFETKFVPGDHLNIFKYLRFANIKICIHATMGYVSVDTRTFLLTVLFPYFCNVYRVKGFITEILLSLMKKKLFARKGPTIFISTQEDLTDLNRLCFCIRSKRLVRYTLSSGNYFYMPIVACVPCSYHIKDLSRTTYFYTVIRRY